jgi:translocation and assembly module TamA
MNRFLCKFLFFVCLLQSSLAFASHSLQFRISGVSDSAQKNILERLHALQQSYGSDLKVNDIQEIYRQAPFNIYQALEPFGYFKAKIISQKLSHQGHTWSADFTVSPGPQVLISKLDIKIKGPGRFNPEITKLLTNLPLKVGQPLEIDTYNKTKNLLLQTANDEGYLNALLEKKEIHINLTRYTAKVTLYLDTGIRFYFGKVSFSNTPFSENFLQRFVLFQQGQPFSSKTLLQLQQDLNKSRYFEQVIITPEIKAAKDQTVPVNVELTVPKAKQYNFGLGYGTFTGPRVTIGTDYRRIGSEGQHFTTQIKISSILSGLAAKYFIPGKNPLTDQYSIGADAQKFSPKNGESFSESFSASYIKTLSDWQHNFSLSYLIERFQIENDPSEVSRFLYPSYSLSRIKVDNIIYPRSGSTFNFTLQGANEHVLASTSFIQSEIKGKYLMSPTTSSRIIVRGDLGYTIVNDLARLPLTLRYLAGGLGSVRGYAFGSIGPGRYLETASAEYQHVIYGNFSGAIFYDIGTATDHFNNGFMRGEGVGIVYNSVIGPVQVYVARAMSKPGKPFSLEFNIGPDL